MADFTCGAGLGTDLAGFGCGGLDGVLLDLSVEGGAGDPEEGGCPALLPACLAECPCDQLLFGLFEAEIGYCLFGSAA